MRLSVRRIVLSSALVVFMTMLLWAPAALAASSLAYSMEFSSHELVTSRVAGYDVIEMEGLRSTLELGRPELPVAFIRFALPDGMTAVSALATVERVSEIPESFRVRPVQPQIPFSLPTIPEWIDPEPSIYESPASYPTVACRLMDTGNMSGHRVATVAVYPLQYSPLAGTLTLNESITVTLQIERDTRASRIPARRSERADQVVVGRIRDFVVNPYDVEEAPALTTRDGDVDYLIVTSSTYESLFQPLADWKEQKGLTTEIVTTSWIYANYAGVDDAEMVRNCIIDYYENHGTLWVLLGGDTNVVPARAAYAYNIGSSSENSPICDLYFSDLDGTWNGDGDGTWGEISHDDLDLYADVYVGRAPVNTTTEASRFVSKVLTYEGAPAGNTLPTDYQENMLFLAEVLWSEPWTDHAICKNYIDDESVPEQFDPITKLYQTNGLLTKSRTMSNLNEGQNITNHNGHANWNVLSIGGSALYRSDFDGMSNGDRQGIFVTIGCYPAAIDYDCIAEHWMNSQGGGVAFVGNSRYGWGSPGGPGNGTSDRYDREFFRQLYNHGNDIIGVTHAAHKDVFVSEARSDGYTRYVLYELNLLGDPEMRIWSHEPSVATVNCPSNIPLSGDPFIVTVQGDNGAIEGVSLYLHNDEIDTVFTTGADGIAEVDIDPTLEGALSMMVTGPDMLPQEITLTIVDQPTDTIAPDPIGTLMAADPFDLGGLVELDWTGYVAPGDFAYYKVYRETTPFADVSGLTPIVSWLLAPDGTTLDDVTVSNAEPYYYAVMAGDLWGNEDVLVDCVGPIAASVNAKVLLWDADDGDMPFDGVNDIFSTEDGTETPWLQALDSIGELYIYSETLPEDLNPFDLIIYLGGVINFGGFNISMTDDEAAALTAFVDAGGSLYVEEPNFGGQYKVNGTETTVALWERFHSTYSMGNAKSTGNVQSLDAVTGTLMDGLYFTYDYQADSDQFVSKVGPDGEPGSTLLWSDQGLETRGTQYVDPPTGSHRYMIPVILGGTTGSGYPSTHLEYVTRILTDINLIGSTGVADDSLGLPNRLHQNVPNPFNPVTAISYAVGIEGAHARLAVYDVAGRLVSILVDGSATAGDHVVAWNGKDSRGTQVSSGVYFVRAVIGDWEASRKMVLLK